MNTANPIDIAFFDVDGTLVDMNTKQISEKTLEALKALKARGIKICISTGRSPMLISDLFKELFDAIAMYNGSLCMAGSTIIRSHPLDKNDVRTILENGAKIGRPMTIATDLGTYTNGSDQDLFDYFAIGNCLLTITPDFDRHLDEEDVYQIMSGGRAAEYDALIAGAPGAKIAAWWDRAVDIIPATGGKGEGVQAILDYFEIPKERAAAFGDGGNDVEMFEAVGRGIAMGNANEAVKRKAAEVCGRCDEEGIYYWCIREGLLEQ